MLPGVPPRSRIALAIGLLATVLLATSRLTAHDIPADVVVRAYLKPEGQRLHMLVRVPLAAMRDINFPLRDPAFLDLPKLGNLPLQGAQTWVADSITIYENDERILAPPEVLSTRISLPSDRSFLSYEEAAAHLKGPELPAGDAARLESGAARRVVRLPDLARTDRDSRSTPSSHGSACVW